jgi:SAM-dependent methyltransferase
MSEPTIPGVSRDALIAAFNGFKNPQYQRHNSRRLEHLASLGLALRGKSVLELGAGIGDHATFFLDRDCTLVSLEPRPENCKIFADTMAMLGAAGYTRTRHGRLITGNIESLDRLVSGTFDVVFCYGLLYHLKDPETMLAVMAARCTELLLLETCVSFGREEAINSLNEPVSDPTQAFDGNGCRPTRLWIFNRLKELFPYVYVPRTQPAHDEFPLDWTVPVATASYTRAIFIGARAPLNNPLLLDDLPDRQTAA